MTPLDKYNYFEGNKLKQCETKYFPEMFIPQSEPCDIWYDWESGTTQHILKHIKRDSNFIDAGANFGYYSLLASVFIETGKIYAIEPNPFVYEVLKVNAALAKNANIVPYNIGLSDGKVDELNLFWYEGANGNGMLYNPATIQNNNTFNRHKVKVATLDAFADKNIDLIKMDIEGSEIEVLQNSDKFFEQNKGVKIILDLHETYITKRRGAFLYEQFLKYLEHNFEVSHKNNVFCVLENK